MKPYTNEAILQVAKDLIAIPSTAHNPKAREAVIDYVTTMIHEADKSITVERFEQGGKPSILAYRGSKRPNNFRIIFNSHLDVVPASDPEQYKPYIKDGKLYGRGAYDVKACAAVLTALFCEYVDTVPYPLALQLVTDEESGGANGAKYQIEQGVRGDFIICGECGRVDGTHEIANEAKGMVCVTLRFRGSSTHGAYPWRGDNAALKALNFVQRMQQRYPVPTEANGETTLNITSIVADSDAHTKTPDLAIVKVDARYAPGDPHFRTKAHFAALIEEIDPNAEILEFHDFSSPLFTSAENPLLVSLKASAEKVEGHEFDLVRHNGTSDGRYFGDVGDEACEFGIAGNNHHGEGEYITLKALDDYIATLRDFMDKTIVSEKDNNHTKAYKA